MSFNLIIISLCVSSLFNLFRSIKRSSTILWILGIMVNILSSSYVFNEIFFSKVPFIDKILMSGVFSVFLGLSLYIYSFLGVFFSFFVSVVGMKLLSTQYTQYLDSIESSNPDGVSVKEDLSEQDYKTFSITFHVYFFFQVCSAFLIYIIPMYLISLIVNFIPFISIIFNFSISAYLFLIFFTYMATEPSSQPNIKLGEFLHRLIFSPLDDLPYICKICAFPLRVMEMAMKVNIFSFLDKKLG